MYQNLGKTDEVFMIVITWWYLKLSFENEIVDAYPSWKSSGLGPWKTQ